MFYKAYCSTTTDNLYAFDDVSVYIMMCMYVVGGIRVTLDMGLVVSTACLWQFAAGWCLQRVSLRYVDMLKTLFNGWGITMGHPTSTQVTMQDLHTRDWNHMRLSIW